MAFSERFSQLAPHARAIFFGPSGLGRRPARPFPHVPKCFNNVATLSLSHLDQKVSHLMPNRPKPIPLHSLIKTADEKAVWQAAYGAAFAQIALRWGSIVRARVGWGSTSDTDATITALRETCALGGAEVDHPPSITVEAQLIAQAAVLEYRRIAS
jgi:hypothetical protein